MNSSVNPFSESSNAAFDQMSTESQADTEIETAPTATASGSDEMVNRQQPIPPPSEPMQYRAIGLVRGRYVPSLEQFTKGELFTTDGIELEAVLLGRIMSLVRNHLDLNQEHLWVVYPRTKQKEGTLHLQIVGVWEPDKLAKPPKSGQSSEVEKPESAIASVAQTDATPRVEDGYFSVRGEIVYQSAPEEHFIVKIKQAARKEFDKPKYFKLKLNGTLDGKAVGQFWDLQVRRQEKDLVLQQGSAIAMLPSKPKINRDRPRKGDYPLPRRNVDTPRPIRKSIDTNPVSRPIPKSSVPKPIKRPKPPN